jgi:hypothetical protein
VQLPHRELVRGIAPADVDDVLCQQEGLQIVHVATEEAEHRRMGAFGRERLVEPLDVTLRVT